MISFKEDQNVLKNLIKQAPKDKEGKGDYALVAMRLACAISMYYNKNDSRKVMVEVDAFTSKLNLPMARKLLFLHIAKLYKNYGKYNRAIKYYNLAQELKYKKQEKTWITGKYMFKDSLIEGALKIIVELEGQIGKTIPLEDIITAAKDKGMSEAECEEVIQKLKKAGDVFEPRRGFISRL